MHRAMTPEQTAAAIIARAVCAREPYAGPKACADGTRCPGCMAAGRAAVEAISAAELLIVPAARLARLLDVERAARALLGSEVAMAAALDGDADRAAQFDPWPEADALVKALVEVVA